MGDIIWMEGMVDIKWREGKEREHTGVIDINSLINFPDLKHIISVRVLLTGQSSDCRV